MVFYGFVIAISVGYLKSLRGRARPAEAHACFDSLAKNMPLPGCTPSSCCKYLPNNGLARKCTA